MDKSPKIAHSSITNSVNEPGTLEKQPKVEYKNYSATSMRMMQKMGFDHNKGLGISGQGIVEPVAAFDHKGRRGLGLKLKGLDAAAAKFQDSTETVSIDEVVEWLPNNANDLNKISANDLNSWLQTGHRLSTIDNENKFCDPAILREILDSKTIFDGVDPDEFTRARSRCNPFETIRKSIFLNRAAVKMANMDAVLDFMFTDPKDEKGLSLVDDLLYFADVCAGPGGFSDYVLWRKKWQAKGFGFTLRNEDDFKLDKFVAGPTETFDPFYGLKQDGNIFDPENIVSYQNYVRSQTHDTGVHFMMADGGFSVNEQEMNIQEIKSKQLYLCQCLTALSIVRDDGSFVVKLFDIFTQFSVGLVYLMYKCFKKICILKPNTSRPANSERYLICKYKLPNTDTILRHLCLTNQRMWNASILNDNSDVDILELVSLHVLKEDSHFFNYIVESNNRIGKNQVANLRKIAAYINDRTLIETRQYDLKKKSLIKWNIPNKVMDTNIDKTFDNLMCDLWFKEIGFKEIEEATIIKPNEKWSVFGDISDWSFVPIATVEGCGKNIQTFFMSCGGRDVYYYANGKWKHLENIVLEISADTLIYGEIVEESIGECKSQTTSFALHIIDGLILGGIDIRSYPLSERLKMCESFANALNKPSKVINNGTMVQRSTISCKNFFEIKYIETFYNQLNQYTCKDGRRRLGVKIRSVGKQDQYYVLCGLLFFNKMKPFLKTHQKVYYFNKMDKRSFFLEQMMLQSNFIGSY